MVTETPTTAPSLYRKWRSRDFSDVVGQGHVTQTLRNAVRSGTVGHAYLFTGPRGTGKTSTARILARAVNCLDPQNGEPCNRCAPCQNMLANRCLDIVEIDAASNNSVDDVRDLRDKVNYAPTEVRRKVYIVDEVHMLSTSAFNALLKTLEEPPAHVLFVLATTDVHKVPATITSRCQRLDFRAISTRDIVGRLAYVCAQEGLAIEQTALELIAQQATGSLRDALSLLEQVHAYEGASIGVSDVEEALGLARRDTLAGLSDSIIAGDVGKALAMIGDLAAAGADMRQYARQLVQYWRDLLLLRSGGTQALGGTPDPAMAAQAERLSVASITAVLKAMLQPDYSGRRSASAQWQLELAVAEAGQYFVAMENTGPRPAPMPVESGRQPASVSSVPVPVEGDRRDVAAGPPPEAVIARSGRPDREREPGEGAASPDGASAVEPSQLRQDILEESAVLAPAPSRQDAEPLNVREVWVRAKRLVKAPRLAAILNGSCEPVRFEGDTLILAFAPQDGFKKEQVELPRSRALIEEALAQAAGRPIGLSCVTMERTPGAPFAEMRDPFVDEAARRLRGVHMDRDT